MKQNGKLVHKCGLRFYGGVGEHFQKRPAVGFASPKRAIPERKKKFPSTFDNYSEVSTTFDLLPHPQVQFKLHPLKVECNFATR